MAHYTSGKHDDSHLDESEKEALQLSMIQRGLVPQFQRPECGRQKCGRQVKPRSVCGRFGRDLMATFRPRNRPRAVDSWGHALRTRPTLPDAEVSDCLGTADTQANASRRIPVTISRLCTALACNRFAQKPPFPHPSSQLKLTSLVPPGRSEWGVQCVRAMLLRCSGLRDELASRHRHSLQQGLNAGIVAHGGHIPHRSSLGSQGHALLQRRRRRPQWPFSHAAPHRAGPDLNGSIVHVGHDDVMTVRSPTGQETVPLERRGRLCHDLFPGANSGKKCVHFLDSKMRPPWCAHTRRLPDSGRKMDPICGHLRRSGVRFFSALERTVFGPPTHPHWPHAAFSCKAPALRRGPT